VTLRAYPCCTAACVQLLERCCLGKLLACGRCSEAAATQLPACLPKRGAQLGCHWQVRCCTACCAVTCTAFLASLLQGYETSPLHCTALRCICHG
jgi:hypothetical protein